MPDVIKMANSGFPILNGMTVQCMMKTGVPMSSGVRSVPESGLLPVGVIENKLTNRFDDPNFYSA